MPPGPDTLPPGASLRLEKKALRGRILALRDRIPEVTRRAVSRELADRIGSLPTFITARTVLVTLPYRSEWDTRPLVEIALRAGKLVAVPRVDRGVRMLTLHEVADLDRDLVPGYAGVPEPRPERSLLAPALIDWVLVPGVAFDTSGRRLGYGGGFYDRLLPLLRADARRIAGAYDLQVVDAVPAGPHDVRVELIATESRTIVVSALAAG